jgi:hypothetical protein
MFRRLGRVLSLIALAAVSAAGCETTTSTTPEEPPDKIVFSLSNTLPITGAVTHHFATGAGEINVRLKVLAPVESVVIGMAMGVWTAGSCEVKIADDNAVFNALLIGTARDPAEFCVRMYDVGKLTEPTDYTIEITHF